jgi:hypothetical protein
VSLLQGESKRFPLSSQPVASVAPQLKLDSVLLRLQLVDALAAHLPFQTRERVQTVQLDFVRLLAG